MLTENECSVWDLATSSGENTQCRDWFLVLNPLCWEGPLQLGVTFISGCIWNLALKLDIYVGGALVVWRLPHLSLMVSPSGTSPPWLDLTCFLIEIVLYWFWIWRQTGITFILLWVLNLRFNMTSEQHSNTSGRKSMFLQIGINTCPCMLYGIFLFCIHSKPL